MTIRIGINPISWSNDDLPSLGGEIPLSTALSEGRTIGYEGFELGNKFPKDPKALRDLMAGYGLAVVSGWYSGRVAAREARDEIIAVDKHLRLLAENDCKVMVYGEVAHAIQGEPVPLYKRPRFHSADEWKRYGERITEFARHTLKHGVRLAYHHHMGAYVESPDDIAQLMANTGDEVGLLFDSGHTYFGGGHPLTVLNQHIDRICHVHCKDVRPDLIRLARNRQWTFLESVLNGVFTVPGDGVIDFAAIVARLKEHGYEGWLVVEAEQDPSVAPSYEYADKGYRTLRGLLDRASLGEAA
ncbi:2-keto-myo-inositol dehydratase [Luteibacter rhizovicinus]|uniref:2-keto-myo-inositol dehydratase n=1 Tax=Luteibacter rhizovicinus TaxID=242606 RepID=A0A4V2W4H5_9GAMM|nr:myo-inosose-2 dehydratase [Luteibacter rhizovicinus]TCV95909.1 2-keto-myo-inositol dehydratase [Luteibacter rhizovicinus]